MSPFRLALRVTSLMLAGVFLFLGGMALRPAAGAPEAGSPVSSALSDLGAVAPFSFVNQLNEPVTLDTLRGKTRVANFIFTRCAGPCPVITGQMSGLVTEFSGKTNLAFVSFTVDPDFDTPPVLKTYAERYNADARRWQFVTGPRDGVMQIIRQSFHLAAEPLPTTESGEIDIMHSLYFVVVNGEGRISGVHDSMDTAAMERLRKDLGKLS